MSGLLQLFSRNGAFLLFFGLEAVCMYLVVNFNSAQQAIFMESWTLYTGRVMERYNAVYNYIGLKEENRLLREELARLRGEAPTTQAVDTAQVDSLANSVDSIHRYVFTPATIINKSPLGNYNTVVIDRGRFSGVDMHQGVVSLKGIVGMVIAVSNRHARVMTLLNRNTQISAGIKHKNYFGSLVWRGTDARYMNLEAIPEYALIAEKDTVVTTGYSNMFPEGIPIGVIEELELKEGDNNYTIKVDLFENIYNLRYVYVVRDQFKGDLEMLNQAN